MMEDLIACLYLFSYSDQAEEALKKDENKLRRIGGPQQDPELRLERQSRESTQSLDNEEDDQPPQGLQLTFSHGPKAGNPGFVIGSDSSSCDIVLPPRPKLSRRHCYFTFDDQRRLIVRDISSTYTKVSYDGQGEKDKRRDFTWIIGGHELADDVKKLVIYFPHGLEFRVVVSKPLRLDSYNENIDRLCANLAENNKLPLGVLGLDSLASTAVGSGSQTPAQDPIFLETKELGRGTFSVVNLAWDVSTGVEYASKNLLSGKKTAMMKEVSIMELSSHEHIVSLVNFMENPTPRLILEYLPLGNLRDEDDRTSISNDEALTILNQGLSALVYLHEKRPSIAHRDIKPENILVLSRDPLHIKLADFGLSKASDFLSTYCGTDIYMAPEIKKGDRYTNAVDIWALGVVTLEFAYDLPRSRKGLPWWNTILNELVLWDQEDPLTKLLCTMIVEDPGSRPSARECLRIAAEIHPSPPESLTPTPTPTPQLKPTPTFSRTGRERQGAVISQSRARCEDSHQIGSSRDSQSQSVNKTVIARLNQATVATRVVEDHPESRQEELPDSSDDTEIEAYVRTIVEDEKQASTRAVGNYADSRREEILDATFDSELQGYIRTSKSIAEKEQSRVLSRVVEDYSDSRQEESLDSISDSEINPYIRTPVGSEHGKMLNDYPVVGHTQPGQEDNFTTQEAPETQSYEWLATAPADNNEEYGLRLYSAVERYLKQDGDQHQSTVEKRKRSTLQSESSALSSSGMSSSVRRKRKS